MRIKMIEIIGNIFFIIGVGLWFYSLSLPVYTVTWGYTGYEPWYEEVIGGLVILKFGFLSSAAWFANITGAVPIFTSRRWPKASVIIALVTIVLSLTSIFFTEVWNDRDPKKQIIIRHLGYYIWHASFFFIFAGAVVSKYVRSKRDQSHLI
jgi:hypothetical protein